MKNGYVFKTGKAGTSLAVISDMGWMRSFVRLPTPSNEGPMVDPAGDVVLAAILRWHWLRSMLTAYDMGVAAFAAGVIQARTQLANQFYWSIGDQTWRLDDSFKHWTSCVVKFAGSFAHKMCANSDAGRRCPASQGLVNNMFYTNGNCLLSRYTSTISDDSGLRGRHVSQLRAQGFMVKPTPKAWAVLSHFMADFSPNGFDIGDKPPPARAVVPTTRSSRDMNLAPAYTLDLLYHAAKVVPGVAMELCHTPWFIEEVRRDWEEWSAERQRYAVWACSVRPDLADQMYLWDIHAANCFDSFLERSIYADTEPHKDARVAGDQRFACPPWAANGPRVRRIVPANLKGRVLLHNVPAV
jgi:hypothetical protein